MENSSPARAAASTLLSDLKVIDLSRLVAGNITSHVLGDLGADVIKVENPSSGDSLRNWTCAGVETWWKVYGRGKRSLALDLRAAETGAILRALLAEADVLVENFRPGTLEKMGLGPEEIWRINPRMVVLRISGWGQDGPYAHKPGFGSLIEAYSGFAAMNGFADRPPVLPPFAMADAFAGVFGAVGVLAAHRAAQATGRGDVIDLSLLEPLFSVLGPLTLEARLTGAPVPRQGSGSPTHAPRNVYRAGDGKFVALSAGTEPMVRRLLTAIGRGELASDARFATHAARIAHRDALDAEIAAFIGGRDREACLEVFERAEVTAGPVMDALDLLSDRFMRARGAILDQTDPDLGNFPSPAPPIRFARARRQPVGAAPSLGAHNREILDQLDLGAAGLDRDERSGPVSLEQVRSILFVSPLADKHLERAPSRGADALQLDLEDAVLPADKAAARARLGRVVSGLRRRGVDRIIVRVNAPWLLATADIAAAVAAGADCITLPKVESADRVAVVAEMLDEHEALQGAGRPPIRILVLIESPKGLENLPSILRASGRVAAVTLGPEDFAAATGTTPVIAANEWANVAVLAAARSAGVTPLGFPGSIALIDDLALFRRQVERARELGFRGAAVIHPRQVAIVNAVFAPTGDEIAEAERIVKAARSAGAGAFLLDGRMVDAPVVQRARALLDGGPGESGT